MTKRHSFSVLAGACAAPFLQVNLCGAWMTATLSVPSANSRQNFYCSSTSLAAASSSSVSTDQDLQTNLGLLERAASTKREDTQKVFQAMVDVERQMRAKAKAEGDAVGQEMLKTLHGSWRLIFTTGTKDTESKFGRINYFPVKAIQTFRINSDKSAPSRIENGIYVGDLCVIQFRGTMTFDVRKRRLEFDFDHVNVFNGLLDIPLKRGQAARMGKQSGLGSTNNEQLVNRGQKAFFNWCAATDTIATARGGGGGLALWQRTQDPGTVGG